MPTALEPTSAPTVYDTSLGDPISEEISSLSGDYLIERTDWADGKIIHSISSGPKKLKVVIESHGILGRPVYELKSEGAILASAYAPSTIQHLFDPWSLNIYNDKGDPLATTSTISNSFGLARSLNLTDLEGKVIAQSNLFSKNEPLSIKFISPKSSAELFSFSIDRSQKSPKWNFHVSEDAKVDERTLSILAALINHNALYASSSKESFTAFLDRRIRPLGSLGLMSLLVSATAFKLFFG